MTIKQDHIIMEKLGVTELRHLIAHTNKGELTLMLRKGDTSYHLVLDAVPIDKDVNKELMDILFPVKIIEVPQVNKGFKAHIEKQIKDNGILAVITDTSKKKGGIENAKVDAHVARAIDVSLRTNLAKEVLTKPVKQRGKPKKVK